MARHGKRETYTVEYPNHYFKPKELLTFVLMKGFDDDWQDLGMSDRDLAAIQVIIMAAPKGNELIQGTGGLRKLRYASSSSSGRRKPIRVCYAYFEEFGQALLIVAYAKNERDNISPADKKIYREMIARQKKVLSKGARR